MTGLGEAGPQPVHCRTGLASELSNLDVLCARANTKGTRARSSDVLWFTADTGDAAA
jgi:hypothetical protein